MRSTLLASLLLLAACTGSGSVRYQAEYSTPELVEVEPGVQVIADYDEPVFYSDNYYWRYNAGIWYRSRDYRRDWVRVEAPAPRVARISRPEVYVHYRANMRADMRDHRDHDDRDDRDHRTYQPQPQPTYQPPPRQPQPGYQPPPPTGYQPPPQPQAQPQPAPPQPQWQPPPDKAERKEERREMREERKDDRRDMKEERKDERRDVREERKDARQDMKEERKEEKQERKEEKREEKDRRKEEKQERKDDRKRGR